MRKQNNLSDPEFSYDYDQENPDGYVYVEPLASCDDPDLYTHYWSLYVFDGISWVFVDAKAGLMGQVSLGICYPGKKYQLHHFVASSNTTCGTHTYAVVNFVY